MPKRSNNFRWADESLTALVGESDRRAKGRLPPGTMNKTELRFANHLALRKQVGEVLWFEFETITFKLGVDCRYTPDFAVMLADCTLEMIDVKARETRTAKDGRQYEKARYEDDSRVKMAIAAARFPFSFAMAFESEDGNWIEEKIV